MTSAIVTVTGNLGRDAETRFTKSGQPLLNFSLAHTPSRKNDQGQWEDTGDTQWYRCTLWGRLAELYADVLLKGQVGQVTVTGRLTPSIFDANDGPRLSLDVAVDSIGVREPKGGAAPRQASAPAGGQQGDPWAQSGGQSFGDEAPF